MNNQSSIYKIEINLKMIKNEIKINLLIKYKKKI
jgi:hypothetical protein